MNAKSEIVPQHQNEANQMSSCSKSAPYSQPCAISFTQLGEWILKKIPYGTIWEQILYTLGILSVYIATSVENFTMVEYTIDQEMFPFKIFLLVRRSNEN